MKAMLTIFSIIIALLLSMAAYAMWANNVPWKDKPGFWARLAIYASQNVAQTEDDALFPELKTRQYPIAADQLLASISDQTKQLNWHIESFDTESRQIHAIVTTKWISFKDDVRIRVEAVDENTSRLHIHSSSRVGRADYAANLGHIIKLQNSL